MISVYDIEHFLNGTSAGIWVRSVLIAIAVTVVLKTVLGLIRSRLREIT